MAYIPPKHHPDTPQTRIPPNPPNHTPPHMVLKGCNENPCRLCISVLVFEIILKLD